MSIRVLAALCLLVVGPAGASEPRQAYFGDLHLHTGLSFDAFLLYGVRTTPDEAFRFARGEPVLVAGRPVRRAWPLDFLAVTDHAEYLGAFTAFDDPASAMSQEPLGRRYHAGEPILWDLVEAIARGESLTTLQATAVAAAWRQEIAAADANNQPGRFTAFVGFEWSPMLDGKAQHRNVIFRDQAAAAPFSAAQSHRPEDLWRYVERARRRGVEALVITNHPNSSGGLAYQVPATQSGRAAWARRRITNEPLSEIITAGGQAETHPTLSPDDRFADFGVKDGLLTGDGKSDPHGGTIRDGLARGLALETAEGTNPFRFGVVGTSDFHNGLSTSDEGAYRGGVGGVDPATDPDFPAGAALNLLSGSGNLTGVWAAENSRAAIFDALRRGETFATSGTRIRVRLLAGWDRDDAPPADPWTAEWGTPMGGRVPPAPDAAARPRLLLGAARAPDSAALERLQIVKLVAPDGLPREQIFDVAVSDGATELRGLWDDPDFDPAVPAAYYVRVLERPTARWSTLSSVVGGRPSPSGIASQIQERAWSSPVWYSPR